jgi:hypothetical protein
MGADDVVNQHGARLCDWRGCRRHAALVFAHGAPFCRDHARAMTALRDDIRAAQRAGDRRYEVSLRFMEQALRKTKCAGHLHYAEEMRRRA